MEVCHLIKEDGKLEKMISSNTSYKLAEIIRDTWPNLYRLPKRNLKMETE